MVAWRTVQDVREVLETMADFPFDRPGKDRTPVGAADEVMAAFPAVRVIIDGKGQGFRRPSGWDD